MKKFILSIALIFLIFFGNNVLFAQRYDSILQELSDKYQPEKIHLHIDRLVFSPGETIWYKAYLMAGMLPSEISKTIYIDFIDDAGKLIAHTTAPIFESVAKGSFDIPASYKGTSISISAYTSWMLNFDPNFLYTKNLTILQPPVKAIASPNKYSLEFFPEGGYLVNGIATKLAFLAYDQQGKPFKAKGVVKDSKGTFIDSIVTRHNGMGEIKLTPKVGNTYNAIWRDEKGKEYTTPLPTALLTGTTLAITGTHERRNFLINKSENAVESQKQVFLMATMNQQMVYRAKIDMSVKNSIAGSIPVAELPTGILQITLFDANWQPLAERITFVNNDNYSMDAQADVMINGIGKRERNVVEIKVYDTVAANLSVAIIDGDIPYEKNNNIVSQLLLTADLKGYVHNPAFYFDSNAEETKEFLELVMLTHGWRKYNWVELASKKLPIITNPPDAVYLTLAGKVNGGNTADYRLAEAVTLILESKDSSKQFLFLPLSKEGVFSQKEMMFYDTLTIYYQFNKNTALANKASVLLANGLLPFPEKLYAYKPQYTLTDTAGIAKYKLYADEQKRLLKLLEGTTLESVTVKAKQKTALEIMDAKYATGLFSGDGYKFDLTNNDARAMGSMNVLAYLQGQVAGLQISNPTGSGNETGVSWRGSATQVFLNQTPVDIQQIMNIPMSDVAYIKVFRPPFFGGAGGGPGGAIAVFTRRGSDVNNTAVTSKLQKQKLAGYTPVKTFFSPDYSVTNNKDEQDIRTTLYWNPSIRTNPKDKKETIIFYNNDISKKIRIVVEGMNQDGQLIHIEKLIEK